MEISKEASPVANVERGFQGKETTKARPCGKSMFLVFKEQQ